MSDSLRERTISGMLWSFMQKFGTMAIAFVANIVSISFAYQSNLLETS